MTDKQWKYHYGDKTTEEVFNENWEIYQKDSDYNAMYRACQKCLRILDTAKQWGEEWINKYIVDPTKCVAQRIIKVVQRVIKKVRTVVQKHVFSSDEHVDWNGIAPQTGNQFYIVELMNSDNVVVWPKIGTTTRPTQERFNEHVGSKQPSSYKQNDITALRVIGIWDCGEIEPEEVESKIRSYLKRKYGIENYIKNDRFSCEIDYDDLKGKIPTVIKNLQAIEVY